MAKNQPTQKQLPIVQRVRIRYTKRGPLRFASHRDLARAFERAILRAGVPIAYSQGFSPHPKLSYASAAPTGTSSECEFLELALHTETDLAQLRSALDAALPAGVDVLAAVPAGPASLAELIEACHWRMELPGIDPGQLGAAVAAFLALPEVLVERTMSQGRRTVDVRAAVLRLVLVSDLSGGSNGRDGQPVTAPCGDSAPPCAILDLVVRQVTPTVRPDDVLAGLRAVAVLELSAPLRATRLAQGLLTEDCGIIDPLTTDRGTAAIGAAAR